jgi:hypothetical protein
MAHRSNHPRNSILGYRTERGTSSKNQTLDYIPEEQLHAVHHYYYNMEPWIEICREIGYAMTFQGGISVVTKMDPGSSAISTSSMKKGNKNNNKQDKGLTSELRPLLEKALDYKKMFGCVPVKIVNDPLAYGGKRAVIPEFGSGSYEKLYERDTMQVKLVFKESLGVASANGIVRGGSDGLTGSDGSSGTYQQQQIHTFVWPNYHPSINGHMRSSIYKLYKRWYENEELMSNLLDSDYNITHPTLITQTVPDKRSIDEFTEEDTYLDAERGSEVISEDSKYKRDVKRSQRMVHQFEYNMGMRAAEAKRKHLISEKNEIAVVPRKTPWQENQFQIQEGEQLVHQIQPKSRNDILDFRAKHEEIVCLTMGIPMAYLLRNKSIKSDTDQELDMLQKMVDNNRQAAIEFYDFLYDIMYREEDNQVLKRLLYMVDENEAAAMTMLEEEYSSSDGKFVDSEAFRDDENGPMVETVNKDDDDNSKKEEGNKTTTKTHRSKIQKAIERVAETPEEIESIAIMQEYQDKRELIKDYYSKTREYLSKMLKKKNRVKLIFLENPFVSMKPVADIALCADRGAITDEEEINLLRSKLGIPKLLPGDPKLLDLLKKREEERKLNKEMLEAKKKPLTKEPSSNSQVKNDKDKEKEKEKDKDKEDNEAKKGAGNKRKSDDNKKEKNNDNDNKTEKKSKKRK